MKLSAPINVLKAQAQELKKEKAISNTEALDLIAKREGFNSWALLQSKKDDMFPKAYDEILGFFNPGDIVLIGSRAGKGKTVFSLGLLAQSIQKKEVKNYCFSFSETAKDVEERLALYDESIEEKNAYFELDFSDDISADYIIEKTKNTVLKNSLIVIDYLQMLDVKISNAPLQVQIEKLKTFAREKECVVIFISQIRKEIEGKADQKPLLEEISLPESVELKFFNKIILLHKAKALSTKVDVLFYRPKEFNFQVGMAQTGKFYSL